MNFSKIYRDSNLCVEENFLYAQAPQTVKADIVGSGEIIYHGARRKQRVELRTGTSQNDEVILKLPSLYVNTDNWEKIKITFYGIGFSTNDVSTFQFNVGLCDGTFDTSIRFQRYSSDDNSKISCLINTDGSEGGFILSREVASIDNLSFELTYQRLYAYEKGLYLAGSTDANIPFGRTLYPYVRIKNTGTDGTEKSIYLNAVKIEYFNE